MLLGYAGLAVALLSSMVILARRADRAPDARGLLSSTSTPPLFLPIALQHARAPDLGPPRRRPRRPADRGGPGDLRRRRDGLDGALRAPVAQRPLLHLLRDLLLHRADPRAWSCGSATAPTARRFVFTLMVVYYVSYAGYFADPGARPPLRAGLQYTVSLIDDADLAHDQRHDQQPREDEARRLPLGPHDDLGRGAAGGLEAGPRRLLVPAADRHGARSSRPSTAGSTTSSTSSRARRSRSSPCRSGTGLRRWMRRVGTPSGPRGEPGRPTALFS